MTTPTPASASTRLDRPALLLQGVVKTFGETRAVDGLDLDVPAGTCLGLLGPNGAGKSTTMRMLTGQAIPDAGTIQVLGYDVPRESKQARARMGVVPQRENLDEELTCRQNLTVWATLLRVPRRSRDAAVASALEAAQLVDRADSKVSTLSGGMRRRLLIARALVHDPALVLLDEPTVGLDPQVRGDIWTLIDRLRSQGVTVLMSTHYIEEAERLCDDVAVVSHGKVIARGTPADARRRARRRRGAGGLRAAAASGTRRGAGPGARLRHAAYRPCRVGPAGGGAALGAARRAG